MGCTMQAGASWGRLLMVVVLLPGGLLPLLELPLLLSQPLPPVLLPLLLLLPVLLLLIQFVLLLAGGGCQQVQQGPVTHGSLPAEGQCTHVAKRKAERGCGGDRGGRRTTPCRQRSGSAAARW